MTMVKICGLTTLEDIQMVNDTRPDYIGLVFAPSRRRVDVAKAAVMAEHLSPAILRAGIFVNQERQFITSCIAQCRLDVVQLHGDETPEDCMDYPCDVWKAIRVSDHSYRDLLPRYQVNAYVLDALVPGLYGGAGQSFDWRLAIAAKAWGPLVLAGGLTPENVTEAAALVGPQVLDVSSGVETAGRKDYRKILKFVEAVRRLKS